MKNFDTDSFVNKLVSQHLKKYPPDSITPRDVIMTIPLKGEDREGFAQRLNSILTLQIFKQAEEHLATIPAKKQTKLTMVPIEKKEITVDDSYIKSFTDKIISAINTEMNQHLEP